jgi:hypothetical protein
VVIILRRYLPAAGDILGLQAPIASGPKNGSIEKQNLDPSVVFLVPS